MPSTTMWTGSLLLLLLLLGLAAGTDPADQAALIALWNGFTVKGNLKWTTTSNLCGQSGITCVNNKVTQLQISNQGTRGTLATEIGALKNLKNLYLDSAKLNGTIPTQIGGLYSLVFIDLRDNSFTGTIPTQIGALTSLDELRLTQTSVSGTLPTFIGFMSSLRIMLLNDNKLSGTIPTEIALMTNLRDFRIFKNSLSGTLPTEVGLLKNLRIFYLENNKLSGSIPTEIGQSSGLAEFHLTSNSLTGTIPTQIGLLKALFNLHLHQNSFYGTIPTELDALPLTYLYLANNYFCPKMDYRTWATNNDYALGAGCLNWGACITSGCHCPGFSSPYCLDDINECEQTPGACGNNSICTNSMGSFTCDCAQGYQRNGAHCTDINECASGIPCHSNATCTNADGSYSCACKTGFSGNGFDCQDIDECILSPCHVNATCTNTLGTFQCVCDDKFEGNGTMCEDIDECKLGTDNCHVNAACINTLGSFSCSCLKGFSGDGLECQDVDECSLPIGPCHANATCANTIGSFSCTCHPEFQGSGLECQDVDECASGIDNCHVNASCTNSVGSFSCACLVGFSGDGINCQDINECNQILAPCDPDATCVNKIGSFGCTCNPGYQGTGVVCQDIDECTLGIHNCHVHASCTNSIGSFSCACNEGISGNGTHCQDIDECAQLPFPCLPWLTCTNNLGGFECACNPGFSDSGSSCQDVNECTTGIHNCHQDALCTNTEGGFSCACLPGFFGTGTDCTAVCNPKYERSTLWPLTNVSTTANFMCTIPSYGVFQGNLANFTRHATRQCLPLDDSREAVWSEKMTPCEPTCVLQGCQNGGACLSSSLFAVCDCPSGYQGRFCEETTSQRCPDIPCLHGDCINPSDIHLPGRCDCTGTGFNGSLCQVDVDDCLSQPCQNGGTCSDNGPNRFLCECPLGFDGLRCQLCKDDICYNGGRCNIAGNGTLGCDCTGTGYSGPFCALLKERDCRVVGCEHNGVCEWSNEEEDMKLCSCASGYHGEFCQAEEYRSLSDPNIVFYVLIPIVAIFLGIVGLVSFTNRKLVKGNNKAWLVLFGHVFMGCMNIFDFFTDSFFVIQCYDLMVNEPAKAYFFFASLASLASSFLTSASITSYVFASWYGSTAFKKLERGPPFGFFLAFAVLANDGIGILHIVADYILLTQQLEIRSSSIGPCLLGFFISKAFLEDLPQLVIQGLYQSQIGRATAFTVFSLTSSACSLFLALIVFIVSDDFKKTREWMSRRLTDEDNFTSPSQGEMRKKSDFELVSPSTSPMIPALGDTVTEVQEAPQRHAQLQAAQHAQV